LICRMFHNGTVRSTRHRRQGASRIDSTEWNIKFSGGTLRPDPLGEPSEVAAFLKIPPKTLAQWRYLGTGPRWSKVGRHVRYRWTDVEEWFNAQARSGSGAA